MAVIRYKNSGVPYWTLKQHPGPTPRINLYKGASCEVEKLYVDELLIINRAYCVRGTEGIMRGVRDCDPLVITKRFRDFNGYEIIPD
jgi:hypothetical protein